MQSRTIALQPGQTVTIGSDQNGIPILASCAASDVPQSFGDYATQFTPYIPYAFVLLCCLIFMGLVRSYGEIAAPKPLHSGIEEYEEDADADDSKK